MQENRADSNFSGHRKMTASLHFHAIHNSFHALNISYCGLGHLFQKVAVHHSAECQDAFVAITAKSPELGVGVFREPSPTGYASMQRMEREETVVALAFPDVVIAIEEILPPSR